MARIFLQLAVLLVIGIVGRTFADEPEKIVGGTDAVLGDFPYQVSLRNYRSHFCGGTLITNRHVLTAAHCTITKNVTKLTVATGTIERRGGEIHKVRSIHNHPDFQDDLDASLKNDIAILTLEDPVVPNLYQSPIRIATSDPPEHAPLRLSGWGRLTTDAGIPTILQKTIVFAMTNEKCKKRMDPTDKLYDTQICALNTKGIGACTGDSGGPLEYNGAVVGIVSWAYACALGIPDIYTRVSQYTDFINNIINNY